MRGQFDGQHDFFRREFFRDGLDGNVHGGERHAQPASVFIRAQQHHGGAPGAGEFGKKFRLAHEFVAGAHDGFLVDGRGDERVQFAAQAALPALAQPGHRGMGGGRRAGAAEFRQRNAGGVNHEKTSTVADSWKTVGAAGAGEGFVQPGQPRFIANQEIPGVVAGRFGGERLEGDFRADAGDIAEGNSKPALHAVIRRIGGRLLVLKVADEGFFLQAVHPLFLQLGLLLGAQGLFNVVADVGERLGVGRLVCPRPA